MISSSNFWLGVKGSDCNFQHLRSSCEFGRDHPNIVRVLQKLVVKASRSMS